MADNEKYLIRLHGKNIEVSEDVYYAYFQMARQERTQDEKLQRNHVVSYDAMDNEGMVSAEAFEDPILLRDFDITDEMMISAFMLESVSFAAPYPVGVTSDMLECFDGELMLKEQSPDRQWLGQIGDIGEELWVYSKTRELLTDDVDHQYLSDSLADVENGSKGC